MTNPRRVCFPDALRGMIQFHFSPMNQAQADIPVASSNVIEDETLADAETKRTNEPKSCLQQAVANLEIKLCSAEEEKFKIKKV